MKLLIITQAVDQENSHLAFFLRWIEEFAKRAERVEVVCLYEGAHSLPSNVRVYSLGKERRRSRVAYVINFYRYVWRLRNEYDCVFVHMNPEYVILGGFLWRIMGKRVALWYMHKSVDFKLRIAEILSNVIFTASKESFRLRSNKVVITGHGIDTDFFYPDTNTSRGKWLLSAGRLSKSKRHDLAIRAAALSHRELRIIGDGPELDSLQALSSSIGAKTTFLGGVTHTVVRDEFRRAAMFIHTSETGSLDKTVLEALACGLRVITTSTALSGLPVVCVKANPEEIATEVERMREVSPEPLAQCVRENHSLHKLIPKLMGYLFKA